MINYFKVCPLTLSEVARLSVVWFSYCSFFPVILGGAAARAGSFACFGVAVGLSGKQMCLCANGSSLSGRHDPQQMNMSEAELSEILGYRSRKSEILSGKRKLSLSMIRKLNEVLRIPAEVLIKAY